MTDLRTELIASTPFLNWFRIPRFDPLDVAATLADPDVVMPRVVRPLGYRRDVFQRTLRTAPAVMIGRPAWMSRHFTVLVWKRTDFYPQPYLDRK